LRIWLKVTSYNFSKIISQKNNKKILLLKEGFWSLLTQKTRNIPVNLSFTRLSTTIALAFWASGFAASGTDFSNMVFSSENVRFINVLTAGLADISATMEK